MLNGKGEMIYSVYPDSEPNAKLRRCQYEAGFTGMAGYIARELVRKKTLSQIDMLREMPSHPVVPGQIIIVDGLKVTIKKHGESVYGRYIWEAHEEGLGELSRMNDIDLIRLLEARLANKYWSYFVGLPITWDAVSEKKVPLVSYIMTRRIDYPWSMILLNHTEQRLIDWSGISSLAPNYILVM